jgi:hypothetical protein
MSQISPVSLLSGKLVLALTFGICLSFRQEGPKHDLPSPLRRIPLLNELGKSLWLIWLQHFGFASALMLKI